MSTREVCLAPAGRAEPGTNLLTDERPPMPARVADRSHERDSPTGESFLQLPYGFFRRRKRWPMRSLLKAPRMKRDSKQARTP